MRNIAVSEFNILLQWFIGASRLGGEINIPSRSQLHKYSQMLSTEVIDRFVRDALGRLAGDGEAAGLEKGIDCSEIYAELQAEGHGHRMGDPDPRPMGGRTATGEGTEAGESRIAEKSEFSD